MLPVNLGARERVGESKRDMSTLCSRAGVQAGIACDGAIRLVLRTVKPTPEYPYRKFQTL
jgi:hypothetical protein